MIFLSGEPMSRTLRERTKKSKEEKSVSLLSLPFRTIACLPTCSQREYGGWLAGCSFTSRCALRLFLPWRVCKQPAVESTKLSLRIVASTPAPHHPPARFAVFSTNHILLCARTNECKDNILIKQVNGGFKITSIITCVGSGSGTEPPYRSSSSSDRTGNRHLCDCGWKRVFKNVRWKDKLRRRNDIHLLADCAAV